MGKAKETVNDYIRRFGQTVGVELDPLDASGYTQVARGSATVGINLFEDQGVIYFLSPVFKVPTARREELYRRLLELNYRHTSEAAFAIDSDRNEVIARLTRGTQGLDYEEFARALNVVSAVADQWDDKLAAEFGDPPPA